jgi:hypothetical protein
MELTYSSQKTDFDPDKRYRNPAHFDRPEAGVTHALVIGDWPKVVEAYEAAGVEVSVSKPLTQSLSQTTDSVAGETNARLEEENGNLRAERDGILGLVVSAEGLAPLEHPGAGELPIRLFHAMLSLNEGLASLTTERDGLAAEVERLHTEVANLKAAAVQSGDDADKVASLKAKLDAANVPYRANASVESLEKAVADLPKA